MAKHKVWVEIDNGAVIRVFKNERDAVLSGKVVEQRPKAEAVKFIRLLVFRRDKYACTHCGAEVTWYAGHMHERVWKGRGGEVSVDNCTTLCSECHRNDPVAGHGNRRLQFSSGVV